MTSSLADLAAQAHIDHLRRTARRRRRYEGRSRPRDEELVRQTIRRLAGTSRVPLRRFSACWRIV